MAETTTNKPLFANVNSTAAIVGYVCVAVGLLLILGITFCLLRHIRLRRARKYIKQQRNHSIAMGPVLTSQPPTAPWKWKEVKANIKARRKGEERPYTAHDKKPKDMKPVVSVISEKSTSSAPADINRPQTANGRHVTLGPSQPKMYGTSPNPQVAHHIKHERLQKRLKAKAERREMKVRQKEIKRDLTLLLEGQKLPGDEFPESKSSAVTHVGPIRRESLQAIPSVTYLIEQSPRDKAIRRSTGLKQLDIPQNLCTWEEERDNKSSSSHLSARNKFGSSSGHVLGPVTVHKVTDNFQGDDDITEL